MFEPSNTSFTFSRLPKTFGPDLLVASLKVSVAVSLSDEADQDDIQLLIDDANWQVYYGDCKNSLARAKSFSIDTCSYYEGRQYVEAAFARVAEVDLPKIPCEVTLEEIAPGSRTFNAMSGYETWLPLQADVRSSNIKHIEDSLVWAIRGYYFEDFLNRAISAQRDAMTFSSAGYEAVAEKFDSVFDSTRIKVPFQRLNY
ncbi:MAG: hypothetical protein ACREBG_15350 [Pyrinomonadaceae bacterium]